MIQCNSDTLNKIAKSVRILSMDGVQKANSGHPGLPLGCAEIGSLLYASIMNYYPQEPQWINRDRFVLSAGHGSMLLYSLLHLSGFDVSLDDLKKFRQLGSKTAGHPEYTFIPGIETTTGPLGQGIANGVGMAMAAAHFASVFNTSAEKIIDHYVYILAGDGCMMEGVASEASSLAGHLKLENLVLFYDSNEITIEGNTSLAFTEDVAARYKAYGWHVQQVDAYDLDGIAKAVETAKQIKGQPSLIVLKSVIAKGAGKMEGSHDAHGAPLGAEIIREAKKNMGVDPDKDFYIFPEASEFFKSMMQEREQAFKGWQIKFESWRKNNPDKAELWDSYFSVPDLSHCQFPAYEVGSKVATRAAGGQVLNAVAKVYPSLMGGSADLAPSNKTDLKGEKSFSAKDYSGRNFHFGVREHAMGAICNGMSLFGGIRPYCSTFLIFSDYYRPAIRLASLMKQPVINILTHDSIFVGEDGPTHQPIEQISSLRMIPGVTVLRPADAQETVEAWKIIVNHTNGPVCLMLTRQNLEVFPKKHPDWEDDIKKGAYIVVDSQGEPDLVVVATGSEVNLAREAMKSFEGKKIRLVSMISRELFMKAGSAFVEKILPKNAAKIAVEAGISYGWGDLVGNGNRVLGIDRFGESGPAEEVAEHLGLTSENLVKMIEKALKNS
ncbi:MAG: transketolase [Spirochaetales bacterium]|nr:transketolase [Spirochaetales bacterium]